MMVSVPACAPATPPNTGASTKPHLAARDRGHEADPIAQPNWPLSPIGKRIGSNTLRVALDAEDALIPVPDLAAQLRELLPEGKAAVADDALGVAGEWPMQTVRMLAPNAINLHFTDYQITPDPYGMGFRIPGPPLGEAAPNWRRFWTPCRIAARDMSVILEHWLPHREDMAATRALEHDWLDRTVDAAKCLVPLT
jgi:hypothetical protein